MKPPLYAPVLTDPELATFGWRAGRVLSSGLGPHDKVLLLTLLRFDLRSAGLALSWPNLAGLVSLSISSTRRAAERLEYLLLLTLIHSKTHDDQFAPNTFAHTLVIDEHPFLKEPDLRRYEEKFLDDFFLLRNTFEATLGELVLKASPAKGSKNQRQGRSSKQAPRPWRQSYGPFAEKGKALLELATFTWKETAHHPEENMKKLVHTYASAYSPLSAETLASTCPSQCVAHFRKKSEQTPPPQR